MGTLLSNRMRKRVIFPGVLDDSANVVLADAAEEFEKFRDGDPAFEVFQDGVRRDANATDGGCAVEFFGIGFDDGAAGPVDGLGHGGSALEISLADWDVCRGRFHCAEDGRSIFTVGHSRLT